MHQVVALIAMASFLSPPPLMGCSTLVPSIRLSFAILLCIPLLSSCPPPHLPPPLCHQMVSTFRSSLVHPHHICSAFFILLPLRFPPPPPHSCTFLILFSHTHIVVIFIIIIVIIIIIIIIISYYYMHFFII